MQIDRHRFQMTNDDVITKYPCFENHFATNSASSRWQAALLQQLAVNCHKCQQKLLFSQKKS